MATADQLRALLESYAEDDRERFLSIATQIAAHLARAGKSRVATDLRALVDQARRSRPAHQAAQPVPIARPSGELAGLLLATYPSQRLADMVLPVDTRAQLERVIYEHRQADRLRAHGLAPRRKLLLTGPPGCGKTMTASALASELSLPLFAVQLHTLITKFMGETAAKLHLVFDAMARTRGVYLFDEFDAIGGHREALNDVGEMRRVLNSFLQFLEREDSDSIIIAATNLVDMLDPALFRRFDDVVRYQLPDEAMIRGLIDNRLALFDVRGLRWKAVIQAAQGSSHAEIVRACEDAAREIVLADSKKITTKVLVSALQRRTRMRSPQPEAKD